jgi:GH25 family lysozyme M1 (1,4-beta-N-acetylmuramidase)
LKKRPDFKQICVLALSLILAALLAACGSPFTRIPAATVDPYAGMVQVESGFGTRMWVERYDELEVSPFLGWSRLDPVPEGCAVSMGVDVSEHQGTIDWAAARADGVEFAIIRAGYRGYGEAGRLVEDPCFRANMEGALAAGVQVGVYFFSQAVTPEEAVEEAEFLLALLADWPAEKLELPVFFDWEDISHDTARTDGLNGETITACAIAFTERVAEAGYAPGIYAYRYLAYFNYDLPRLTDCALWVGALGAESDFYYAHAFWQNAVADGIRGIEGPVDRDFWFRLPEPAAEPVQDE